MRYIALPTRNTRRTGFVAGTEGRLRSLLFSTQLSSAEFEINILNPRADPFHSRLNFFFGHIERFGPVPQFVIFTHIDELGIGPYLLCHLTNQPSGSDIGGKY